MEQENEQVWKEIQEFFKAQSLPFQLGKSLQHNSNEVSLVIDVDPGGGFESGFEFTSLSADLPVQFTSFKTRMQGNNFKFSIHRQHMLHGIAKFLGMEDVATGFKDFDDAFIIKTNNPALFKKIFSNEETRKCLQQHPDISLQFTEGDHENDPSTLEMIIDVAVTDMQQLKNLYNCFGNILDEIKQSS